MKALEDSGRKGLIELRGKTFDTAEYEALRREMDYRVNVAYGHGFTLISVILVFFSAIFVFIAEILKMAMEPDSIFGVSIWYDLGVVFAISVFCAVPVFIVYSFSVKYEDNLRQICNIAAYQKVFHEYPSLIRREVSDQTVGVKGWEMLHCNPDVPQAKVIGLGICRRLCGGRRPVHPLMACAEHMQLCYAATIFQERTACGERRRYLYLLSALCRDGDLSFSSAPKNVQKYKRGRGHRQIFARLYEAVSVHSV